MGGSNKCSPFRTTRPQNPSQPTARAHCASSRTRSQIALTTVAPPPLPLPPRCTRFYIYTVPKWLADDKRPRRNATHTHSVCRPPLPQRDAHAASSTAHASVTRSARGREKTISVFRWLRCASAPNWRCVPTRTSLAVAVAVAAAGVRACVFCIHVFRVCDCARARVLTCTRTLRTATTHNGIIKGADTHS